MSKKRTNLLTDRQIIIRYVQNEMADNLVAMRLELEPNTNEMPETIKQRGLQMLRNCHGTELGKELSRRTDWVMSQSWSVEIIEEARGEM